MGFPYIQNAVFSFFAKVLKKHLHFSHFEVTPLNHKGQFICGQFDNVACCMYNFYSGTSQATGIMEFWSLLLEQQFKVVITC